MKRFGWAWFAASSVLLSSILIDAATAETRPQYGGTLHIAMREVPGSLDPNDVTQPDSFARTNLLALIFETLVTVDERARVHPALAVEWQAASGKQRWQFRLRRGVKFHDGSALTAGIAASALRTANPTWKVFAEGESVVIELDRGDADLAAELALSRNSVVKRNGNGKLSGTGAFHIEDWQAAKKVTLVAEENYWRGRAFVDRIELEMGRNFHDQLVELDLGRADLIEVAPESGHRVTTDGRRISSSQPMELLALVFGGAAQSAEEKHWRRALAYSVERASMRTVVLQGTGQAAGSILPNWMTGYGFAFSSEANLELARREREQVRTAPSLTVGYDANDSLARVLAERATLNARDAGINLQPTTSAKSDLRLVRIDLVSADPWIALQSVAATLGIAMPKVNGSSVEELYSAEQALVAGQQVIPLFHLPAEWATSALLQDWNPAANGEWRLEDVWLGKVATGKEKP
jgi:peptide/nickel transport system substrate-binding protein